MTACATLIPTKANAATLGGTSTAKVAVAPWTIRALLKKEIVTGLIGEAAYDLLAKPLLNAIPGLAEDTDLESAFDAANIETFLAAGGAVFYTDKNGKLADYQIAALAPFVSSEQTSAIVTRPAPAFRIEGKSLENAPYLVELKTVLAKTTDGFFTDDVAEVNVSGFTLETGEETLTGEKMYAGGFSIAYIDGEFQAIGINFTTEPIKTVPEPITIIGSAMGLGLGVLYKKSIQKKRIK